MNDSDTTLPVDRPVNMSDFAHLFWMAGVLAFASVFLYVAIKVSQDTAPVVLFGCMLSGSALATAFVGSVWAVLGPGSYLKRLFWSHLFIAFVGLGHLAGFTLLSLPVVFFVANQRVRNGLSADRGLHFYLFCFVGSNNRIS